MKRRTFLRTTILSYLALNLPLRSKVFASTKTERASLIYATRVDGQCFINLFQTDNSQLIKLPVPFRVHSVSDLGDKKVLLIEKKGRGCCVVDFAKRKILKTVQAQPEEVFYGHAEIDFSSRKIYFPQRMNGKNHIFIRSLDTLDKISDSIYQSDKEIHMISMLEEDRLAICIDDKKASSFDILNLKNHSVRSTPIEDNYFRPGHLCPISEGTMYVTGIVGNDYDGAAILNYHFKELTYLDKPHLKKLKPVFWLKLHPQSKVICGVSPDSNEVLFISHPSRKIIKQMTIPGPYGVDISGNQFIVIGPKGLTYFDATKLQQVKTLAYPDMGHILEDFHPIFI